MPQTGNGQKKLPGKPVEFYTIIKKTKTKRQEGVRPYNRWRDYLLGVGVGRGGGGGLPLETGTGKRGKRDREISRDTEEAGGACPLLGGGISTCAQRPSCQDPEQTICSA